WLALMLVRSALPAKFRRRFNGIYVNGLSSIVYKRASITSSRRSASKIRLSRTGCSRSSRLSPPAAPGPPPSARLRGLLAPRAPPGRATPRPSCTPAGRALTGRTGQELAQNSPVFKPYVCPELESVTNQDRFVGSGGLFSCDFRMFDP